MPDPCIVRFRRVVTSAYAYLEERRQEVNDLNVFPVADGDTGDNMAMTMRAVMEELDRLDGLEVDEIGRTELVQALARAALMGARGNSGVILSQIVRGAAEELASRPGELVDPVLVAAAFASAADAAYDSVREPAEGTMLTVFREMAHSVARQLSRLEADSQRLNRGVSDEQQDAILAEVLERAIADGERAVARTPEQLEVLRESGVVDAGGYGLVLILAGVVAGLRGTARAARDRPPRGAAAEPAPPRGQPLPLLHQLHRLRHRPRLPRLPAAARGAGRLGAGRRRRGDAQGPRPHRRARGRRRPLRGRGRGHQPRRRRHARAGRRAHAPASQRGRTGVVAVAAGEGLKRLFAELGADVVPGGETLNPSTYELLAGIHEVPAEEVLVLPSSANVIMAAERACELSEKPARVVRSPPSRPACWPWSSSTPRPPPTKTPSGSRRRSAGSPPAASPRPPATTPRAASQGDAVGFAAGEIVAWGGAGSTLATTIERLAEGAEIVTVIAGEGAPIPLSEIDTHVPDGVEIETHEGGQPSWWWLLAAQ